MKFLSEVLRRALLALVVASSAVYAQEFTFESPPTNFVMGVKSEDMMVGDFDNDNNLDVVVGNTYHQVGADLLGSINVLFGDGAGNFTNSGEILTSGPRIEGVAVGDFNSDGFDDVAVTNYSESAVGGTPGMKVLLSNGAARTFSLSQSFVLPALSEPRHIRPGDFNNDGRVDLVTADFRGDTATIYLGNGTGSTGNGTFAIQFPSISVGDQPETVTVCNLDGDSNQDVMVTNAGDDTITLLHGNGNGTFTNEGVIDLATLGAPGGEPRFTTAFDFDNDNRDDVVTTFWNSPSSVWVLSNDGAGTAFTFEVELATSGNSRPLFGNVGDLNNDAIPDVVVSYSNNDELSFFPGQAAGTFTFGTAPDIAAGNTPYATIIDDFDGDGLNDLFVSHVVPETSGCPAPHCPAQVRFYHGFTPPPPPPPFVQDNGSDKLLVFEAEHFHTQRSDSPGTHDFVFTTGESGFVDSGAMAILPSNGGRWKTAGYSSTAPELTFHFQAVTSGTHYVHMRMAGSSGGDNSLHGGLDGAETPTLAKIEMTPGAGWVWSFTNATVNIPAPGNYDFHVWGREDGTKLDRVVLTTNSNYDPSTVNGGDGPPESPTSGNTPPDAMDDTDTVDEDTTNNVIDVLANDDDAETPLTLTILSVTVPDMGGIATRITGNTEIDYTPAVDFSGVETFQYTIEDDEGAQDTATVTITVNNTNNDGPTALDDSATVITNTLDNVIDVLLNDNDPDVGDSKSIFSVTQPADGFVSIQGGNLALLYDAGTAIGDQTFDYTMQDAGGLMSTATVTVTVSDPGAAFLQDAGADGNLVMEAENFHNSTQGSAGTGSGTWDPVSTPAGFTGDEAVWISQSTSGPWKTSGFSAISPSVEYDFIATKTGLHNIWIRGSGTSTSRNSVHIGLDGVEPPTGDKVEFAATNTWVWSTSPRQINITSTGPHTLFIWGREEQSKLDRIWITSNLSATPSSPSDATNFSESPMGGGGPVNQPPVPVADGFGFVEDTTNETLSVLANDNDPETGTPGTLVISDPGTPDQGGSVLLINGDTEIQYSPAADFSGTEMFTYTVIDEIGATATADVTISVTNTNDPPTAVFDSFSIVVNVLGTNLDVLANDTDPDHPIPGDTKVITAVTQPSEGTVTIRGDNLALIYNAGSTEIDQNFTYTMDDGLGAQSVGNVTVTQTAAGSGFLQDSGAGGHLVMEAENYHTATQGSSGTGSGTWDPVSTPAGFTGAEAMWIESPTAGQWKSTGYSAISPELEFEFTATHTGLHNIWYRGASTSTTQNSCHIGLDGIEPATNDSVSIAATGDWVWSNSARRVNITTLGPHTIQFWGRERRTKVDRIWVTSDLTATPSNTNTTPSNATDLPESPTGGGGPPPNQAPVADDDNYTGVPEDSVDFVLDVLANDMDPDGHPFEITLVGTPDMGGTAVANGTNDAILYTPMIGFTGTESFDYTIEDIPGMLPSVATVTVTISPNQAPVADDDNYTNVPEDSVDFVLDVLVNDIDPDGHPFEITLVGTPDMGGTAVANGTNDAILYTPMIGFTGTESFDYTIEDIPGMLPSIATVTVTVVAPSVGNGSFVQDSGLDGNLVMEAENAHRNLPSSDGDNATWDDVATPAGAVGFARWIGQSGSGPWKKVGFSGISPVLEFDFTATHTGLHNVWMRAQGGGTANNSVHIGLDGVEPSLSDKVEMAANAGWVWNTDAKQINITTLGLHTLQVWGRERQTKVDRLWVTANLATVPGAGSSGPPESPGGSGSSATIQHVIHVSVDGLMSDAITALGPANAPNFFALAAQGASTLNARTDPTHTDTLPNHTSQFTGRPVDGASGHAWANNDSCGSSPFATIHEAKGSYVQSVFDVVHDNSFSTALYVGKTKFCVFNDSWDGTNGAADATGVDNGTDKVDTYSLNTSSSATLAANFVSDMTTSNFNYAVLHLRDPDSSGHGSNWDLTAASDYLNAIEAVDDILGDLLTLVSTDPDLTGTTAIILTSDHGGELGTGSHTTTLSDLNNHQIPFYVWGPGVSAGSDLYTLNTTTRTDPVATIPDMTTGGPSAQPIRNGDAANLALQLLELPAISGSVINSTQDLNVAGAP